MNFPARLAERVDVHGDGEQLLVQRKRRTVRRGDQSTWAALLTTPPSQKRSVSPVQPPGLARPFLIIEWPMPVLCAVAPLRCRGPNHAKGEHRQDLCHDMKAAASANWDGRQN